MTAETKIDPQLLQRMAAGDSSFLPVLIEMTDQPESPPTLDRRAELDRLGERSDASRTSVQDHLRQLGVAAEDIETFAIVNALAVRLPPDLIGIVAERQDVRFIRYNGQSNVAI